MKTILKEKEVVKIEPKFPGLYKYLPNGSVWLITDVHVGTCIVKSPKNIGEPVGCHCTSLTSVANQYLRDTWRYLDPADTVTLSND